MATIYDVARLAGVSPKTVSRVLNADAPVSSKTREAVASAMDALGYVPSSAARSIKSQRSGLIGLITGAISSAGEITSRGGLPDILIVEGVQRVVERAKKTLLISDTGGRLDRVPDLIRTFRQHRVEGLLYVSDFHQKLSIPASFGSVPTVLVNCYDDMATPSVLPDDEAGQYALTQEVIAAGHRRIAYLCLGLELDATRLRMAGMKAALAEAEIPFDPALVAAADLFGGDGEHQLIWESLDRFLRLPDPPSVICCGNDRIAMAAYGILRERGFSIPDDISVTGFDDHPLIAQALYPPLSSVELPYRAMGVRSAELLMGMIANPPVSAPEEPILVRGQANIRGSLSTRVGTRSNIIDLKGRTRE